MIVFERLIRIHLSEVVWLEIFIYPNLLSLRRSIKWRLEFLDYVLEITCIYNSVLISFKSQSNFYLDFAEGLEYYYVQSLIINLTLFI